MLKRPHIIALGLVLVLTLVVLSLPHNAASRLKLAIGSLFLPLFGLSKSTHQLANKTGDAQSEELRRGNQVAQAVAAQNEALLRENERLRQLFNWEKQSPWRDRLRLANVIATDPANWWETIQIDRGSRDGLRADLPVLDPAGFLVGRISSVSLTRAQVVLLGNPASHVSARVDKSGENGIINGGASPVDTSLVTLSFLPGTSNVKPGQAVFTSGLTTLPRDIRIGQIAENPRATEAGNSEVRVKLGASPGTLEEVWVLMP